LAPELGKKNRQAAGYMGHVSILDVKKPEQLIKHTPASFGNLARFALNLKTFNH
jgi:hypothetical protein